MNNWPSHDELSSVRDEPISTRDAVREIADLLYALLYETESHAESCGGGIRMGSGPDDVARTLVARLALPEPEDPR